MKKLITIPLAALALLALLAACGDTADDTEQEQQEQQAQITRELQQSGSVQPGAKVEFSTGEDGNLEFTYDNPDGTGGGGAVLD